MSGPWTAFGVAVRSCEDRPEMLESATADAMSPWPVLMATNGVMTVPTANRNQPAHSVGLYIVLILAVFVNFFLHFYQPCISLLWALC